MAQNNLGNALSIIQHPIIDPQIEAYRKRDIETFASFYATEVKAFRNGEPFLSGIEDLKVKYKELFELSPALAIEISERRIEEPYIYDTELITGLRGNSQQIVVRVRYKIADAKIIEVLMTRD